MTRPHFPRANGISRLKYRQERVEAGIQKMGDLPLVSLLVGSMEAVIQKKTGDLASVSLATVTTV